MKERGETLRRFDVRTSDHMMSTALKIKNKPEDGHRDKHVVKTFNPTSSSATHGSRAWATWMRSSGCISTKSPPRPPITACITRTRRAR